MQKEPLQRTLLPMNMSAELAKDLATLVTGHAKETDLVRYLSLALHYSSWTLNRDGSLRDYEARMMSFPTESSSHLLELLTLPTAYALQGLDNGAPRELVRQAQRAAATWRQALSERGADVLRLHQRAIVLLADMLEDDYDEQDANARDIQAAVIHRHPEVQLRRAVTGARPSRGLALSANGAEMRHFASPVEALQFVFQQLHQARQGLASAGADEKAQAMVGQATTRLPEGSAALSEPVEPTKPAHRLFNPAKAAAALQRLPSSFMPGEGNAQQRRLLDQMSNDTGWRNLTETPSATPLDSLRERFPHFEKVIDHIEASLALSACGEDGRTVRIAPLLLRGAPGCGKTYFAQELAKVLQTEYVERDLSVTSEAFVIAGMDSTWKNSKPGVVFDALVNGKAANPVICLNEVDKAKSSGTHNSPMAALYALLEPTSAEAFTDEFIPVPLDASRVVWVLTANDGDIPEPILSRLEVFNIENPTPEQCRTIAQSVWKSLCEKLLPRGHGFPEQLSKDVLDEMQSMSPRLMRKALTAAAGNAALSGRKVVEPQDLSRAGDRYRDVPRRTIGFSASM